MPTPGVLEYPAALDSALTLIQASNNASATLTSNISVGDLLIPVDQPGKFTESGIATLTDSITPWVTPPTKIEIFVYTSKSGSNLVVPVGGRGAQGTTAQAFSTGNFVEQRPTARHHTALADLLLLLEAKLGVGANTPGGSAQALFSDAAGASLWRAITQADVAGLVSALAVLGGDIDAAELALAGKQPLDADLTAIAALVANGFLRKVAGVWQISEPKTAWSIPWFIADPSTFPLGQNQGLPKYVCPNGVAVTGTHTKVVSDNGNHTPGGALQFVFIRRTAAAGWGDPAAVAVATLDNANNLADVVYTEPWGVPLVSGDTIEAVLNIRAGTITERNVTFAMVGTQQLI